MNRAYPYPYIVTGVHKDGKKIRKRAPFNTAREQARRLRQRAR